MAVDIMDQTVQAVAVGPFGRIDMFFVPSLRVYSDLAADLTLPRGYEFS